MSDKRQVADSMGVVAQAFVQVEPGNATDLSSSVAFASPFMPNGIHVRQIMIARYPRRTRLTVDSDLE